MVGTAIKKNSHLSQLKTYPTQVSERQSVQEEERTAFIDRISLGILNSRPSRRPAGLVTRTNAGRLLGVRERFARQGREDRFEKGKDILPAIPLRRPCSRGKEGRGEMKWNGWGADGAERYRRGGGGYS